MLNTNISNIISLELNVKASQILAAINLLDEGNTIPFIARYRKELTEGLDDTQLRYFETRLTYLRELAERKQTILASIEEQGKLTLELQEKIDNCMQKTELEDLYLPYKPKKRTKSQIAIEAGLEPLANDLWNNPDLVPEIEAEKYISPEHKIDDVKAALDGAKHILMSRLSEDADLLAKVRKYLKENAHFEAKVIEGKEELGAKFKDYFDYSDNINNIPSHRALAILRGRNESILNVSLNPDPYNTQDNLMPTTTNSYGEEIITEHFNIKLQDKPADKWRKQVVAWTWKIKILLHMETELISELKEKAEEEAIDVFAKNLHSLLMVAPAGAQITMGLDPGIRTGVKVAIVDVTGKLLATDTIYPHTGQYELSKHKIYTLIQKYNVTLIAIGNGTASRETEKLVDDIQKQAKDINIQKVIVSEAGASVYSASELAAQEFPTLDVSLRGAVSIARRLQDPLAELVKIEPKAIGVGQYQHDVNQTKLAKKLDAVIEDSVNAVGVDLNTASAPLLTRVAGLSNSLANNIIQYRDENGKFENREILKQVTRLGPKAFEQCAGFLRITDGSNILDASCVHPEAYSVVNKILNDYKLDIHGLMGNTKFIQQINPQDYTDAKFGLPTINDILKELEKPGRDPRGEFKTASFKEGVETISDLKTGMILEGTVTNVTNFGAFIDIGVHQDGLVHISALSNSFIDDPHKVVKTGDIVTVKVMEIEINRSRIALSMKLDDNHKANKTHATQKNSTNNQAITKNNKQKVQTNNVFADALKNWKN